MGLREEGKGERGGKGVEGVVEMLGVVGKGGLEHYSPVPALWSASYLVGGAYSLL